MGLAEPNNSSSSMKHGLASTVHAGSGGGKGRVALWLTAATFTAGAMALTSLWGQVGNCTARVASWTLAFSSDRRQQGHDSAAAAIGEGGGVQHTRTARHWHGAGVCTAVGHRMTKLWN